MTSYINNLLLKHHLGDSFVVLSCRSSTLHLASTIRARLFATASTVLAQGANRVAEPLLNVQKIIINELDVAPDKNNKVENVTDFVQEDFDGNVREDLAPLEIPLPQTTPALSDGNPTPSPPATSLPTPRPVRRPSRSNVPCETALLHLGKGGPKPTGSKRQLCGALSSHSSQHRTTLPLCDSFDGHFKGDLVCEWEQRTALKTWC